MQISKKTRYRIWIQVEDMNVLIEKNQLCIEGKNYHYLIHVIRLKEGDYIECIAQNGIFATTQIITQTRTHVTLTLLTKYAKTPPNYTIILALGASKQVRRSFLLEKCVELCLHEVWIWKGEHSQVAPTIKDSWYEVLYNAATQCGNPFIPLLRSFSSIQAMIEYAQTQKTKQICFHEDATCTQPTQYMEWDAHSQALVLIIGCEGGFSHNEFSFLRNQGIPARSLGSTRLRFETASLVASSIAVMLNDPKGISHK